MFLEKLEIQGFKSFANKNELIFPGFLAGGKRGITAVVGPNGSGKSNVADAVRWVMGEQSMKTLRGKKSDDIIFAGSDKRGKLGMAEVSLYLNNEDGSAPIDYAQLVITRRLFRDGASEYIINGARVRLFDIQMLLAKANIGHKTYSVIGQGMVESFLNTSLSERKEFFDEATGVRQYQIKRDDALNKLRGSLENLGQSQMLLNEIEPHLKTLTKQVAKLEKRESLATELAALQKDYYSGAWQELDRQLSAVNSELLNLEKNKDDKEKKIAVVNDELSTIEQEQSVSANFADLQSKVSDWQEEKSRLAGYLVKLNDWLELKNSQVNTVDLTSLEAERLKLKESLESVTKTVSEWQAASASADHSNEWQSEIRQLSAEHDRLSKDYQRLDAWLEMKLEASGKFDLSFLNNRRSEITKTSAELKIAITEDENLITSQSAILDKHREELQEIKNNLMAAKAELHQFGSVDQEKVVAEVSQRLEQSLSKLSSVDQEEDLTKIKNILAEIKLDLEKVLSLSTGQDFREKINRLQSQVTHYGDKQEELLHQISGLQSELSIAQSRLRASRDKDSQLAREAVDVENKLKQAEDKFDASEVRVSQAGITEKIKPIETELADLRAKLSAWQIKQSEIRVELSSSQSKANEYRNSLNHLEQEINQAKLHRARYEARLESAQQALQSVLGSELSLELVSKAQGKAEADITSLANSISEAQSKLRLFNEEQEQKRQHLLNLQRNLHSLQNEANQLSNQLNELKIKAARLETKLEDLENEIRTDFGDLNIIKQHKVTDQLDRSEALSRIKNLRHQLDLIGGIDPEAEKEYKETKDRFDFLDRQTSDLNQTIKSLEEIIRELDGTIKERFDREFKIIEQKFQEYFKILFNGGSAKIIRVMADEMQAAEPEQPPLPGHEKLVSPSEAALKRIKLLQRYDSTGLAGIEIVATPPGKKIQSIAVLSGGERALTAIALICAIISANPSPFVMLDEVDAALDEANSDRLAQILEDLSHKTQFIVITHNRAPMRKASVLYGVTMGDDSVSKLLSVKLEDIKVE